MAKRVNIFSELDMAKHYGQYFASVYNKHKDMDVSDIADRAKLWWQGVFNPCDVDIILCNDIPYSMYVSFNDVRYELRFNIYPNCNEVLQFSSVRVDND